MKLKIKPVAVQFVECKGMSGVERTNDIQPAIEVIAAKIGSACDIWMEEGLKRETCEIFHSGAKLIQSSSKRRTEDLVAKGWLLLGEELNCGSYDAVLYVR
jgi:hypothetical protein